MFEKSRFRERNNSAIKVYSVDITLAVRIITLSGRDGKGMFYGKGMFSHQGNLVARFVTLLLKS